MIFKVSIFHSYFENSICNCLSINLKPDAAFILKRFNFLIRNTINGIEFYSNSSNVPALLNYISESTRLSSFDFELTANNDCFNYFTDLPMNWAGQLEYNSNSKSNLQEEGNIQLVAQLSQSMYQPILGNMVIHFTNIMNNVPAQFTINYKARATQWQYFIINKSAMKLDHPKIVGKSEIEFEGPQNITIETGEKAMLFSSNQNLIPLNALPVYKFDLIDSPTKEIIKNAPIKTIVKGLPTPSVAQMGIIKSDIKLVSSPIYVYV